MSVLCCLSTPSSALDAPDISAAREGGIIRFEVSSPNAYDGYNVYRDGRYTQTVRPSGSTRSFNVPAVAGRYCIVGFAGSGAGAAFSPCSDALRVGDTNGAAFYAPGDVTGGSTESSGGGSASPLIAGPADVRIQRYSSTAAELFWSQPTDGERPTAYRVLRNGSEILRDHVFSRFETGLDPSMSYRYEVQSMASDGSLSAVARVELAAVQDAYYPASPYPSSATAVGNPSDGTSTDAGYPGSAPSGATLNLLRSDIVLHEGEREAIRIPIRLSRDTGITLPVKLSLEAASGGALDNVSHWFEPAQLEAGAQSSVLRMLLSIDQAPILAHSRDYRLIARAASDPQRELARLSFRIAIEPVDAPDVYLLIGQSNMVGNSEWDARRRGAGQVDEPHPRIRQLNVRQNNRDLFDADWKFSSKGENTRQPTYITAEDPLHEPYSEWQGYKSGNHIGPGLSFAKTALAHTSRTIYLVPAAWGATGFCTNVFGNIGWNARPNSAPYLGNSLLTDRALTRLDMTLRDTGGILRGILWHQGGADANDADCANTYRQNLSALAARLRADARVDRRGESARGEQADIPFIVATQSRGADARGDYSIFSWTKQIVDAAHREVASYIPHADVVDNDDLVPPDYPCGSSSCVHFGARAYRETGRRFHEALLRVTSR